MEIPKDEGSAWFCLYITLGDNPLEACFYDEPESHLKRWLEPTTRGDSGETDILYSVFLMLAAV